MAIVFEPVTEIETLDSARILNQEINDWEKGWLKVYKRHRVITFFSSRAIGTIKAESLRFNCAPYSEFELLLNITASGGSNVLTIDVETSDDGATWYKRTDLPFGALNWEGTLGNKKESYPGKCTSPYIRLAGITTGGSFTVTGKIVFAS